MQRVRSVAIAITALALVGAAPACGAKKVTKATYIAKVDPICQKYADQSKSLAQPANTSDVVALADYVDKLGNLYQQQLDEITKVKRPEANKKELDGIFAGERAQIQTTHDFSTAIRAKDATKAQQIETQIGTTGQATAASLKTFGFKVCGNV